MFKLVEDRTQMGTDLCVVVADAINQCIDCDNNVIALEADLAGASKSGRIQEKHPDNYIQCGIAEANMFGVAAGLSVKGFVPFVHTFAPFATRRVFDQLYLSGAYSKNTINIYGSDPGFTVAANGGTHTSFEDVAMMREIPGAIVVDVADDTQLDWVVKEFAKMEGIHYFRANRKPVRNVYQKGSTFSLGKGNVLTQGQDVLIITAGQLVSDALDCAQHLQEEGVSCEVIDMFTIKPLDVDLILSESKGKKAIVTFENHSVIGGLGSAVAEVVAEYSINIPFKRHGVKDCFGQVGTADYLQKEFQLTASDLEDTIKNLLKEG